MRQKKSTITIADLKRFAKREARLSFADYGDRESYRQDRNNILRAQRAAKKAAGIYWTAFDSRELVQGSYSGGRLLITKTGIEYIAGQYAPTEIYWALESYFTDMRR